MTRYTIEHRAPAEGEDYLTQDEETGALIVERAPAGHNALCNVIVPCPEWPASGVGTLDAYPDDTLDFLPAPLLRAPDGSWVVLSLAGSRYVSLPPVPPAEARFTAYEPVGSARREYTVSDLDALPAGACFWDECGLVWQKTLDDDEPSWAQPGTEGWHTNPIHTGYVRRAYDAPEETTRA